MTYLCNKTYIMLYQIMNDHCVCTHDVVHLHVYIIGMAGYSISDNKMIKTHYDKLTEIPVSELPKLVCQLN